MQSIWIFVLLVTTATVATFSACKDYEAPAPEKEFTKPTTSSTDQQPVIPRSGLMISARGWLPAFVHQPRIFKHSVPLHKFLVRPVNVPVA
ncbi:hypothetical protein GCK72_020507 [Caenorhabditis remanei]|uniref:Uncharacterized protein n=1 Tax=Caenorhabditis remanei TaxID=31234 RepID=A0A6A5GFQ1_CAERE|nr:hypothetical protein GCK72_020507 [Caenorhabditis remanei]KAF1753950.1 hypothetical protein GCK72_020507 [Caenorhabditis remanei]